VQQLSDKGKEFAIPHKIAHLDGLAAENFIIPSISASKRDWEDNP
jgi:hypothetical protein